MFKYKILIKLFVLNSMREGCSSAVHIVSQSKHCGVDVSAGLSVLKKKQSTTLLEW